jgi:hypothetical protein
MLVEEDPTIGDIIRLVIVRLSVSDEVGYRINAVVLCSLEIVFHLCTILHLVLI